MKILPLALASGLALTAFLPTQAQSTSATQNKADLDAAKEELRRSREELRTLSSRIGELSLQIAGDNIEAVMRHPGFDRPALGIVLRPIEGEGVAIAAVTPDGPAQQAGLRSGDVLIAIDGHPVGKGEPADRLKRARELIGPLDEGRSVALQYRRDGQLATTSATAKALTGVTRIHHIRSGDAPIAREGLKVLLSELPQSITLLNCEEGEADCTKAALGDALRLRALRMTTLDPQLGRYFGTDKGVLVLSTGNGGLETLQAGDVILAVDGTEVDSPREVLKALRGQNDDALGKVDIRLLRDRKSLNVEVEAPALPALAPLTPPAPPAPPAAAPAAPPAPPTPPVMLI